MISLRIRATSNVPLQTIKTELAAAGMAKSSSDKTHKARHPNITGITIIGRVYLCHKTSLTTRQKYTRIEHEEQINYIKLLNKMMVCFLA